MSDLPSAKGFLKAPVRSPHAGDLAPTTQENPGQLYPGDNTPDGQKDGNVSAHTEKAK